MLHSDTLGYKVETEMKLVPELQKCSNQQISETINHIRQWIYVICSTLVS